jgi:hypothetical protein
MLWGLFTKRESTTIRYGVIFKSHLKRRTHFVESDSAPDWDSHPAVVIVGDETFPKEWVEAVLPRKDIPVPEPEDGDFGNYGGSA